MRSGGTATKSSDKARKPLALSRFAASAMERALRNHPTLANSATLHISKFSERAVGAPQEFYKAQVQKWPFEVSSWELPKLALT